jgi:hypothetical protein
LEIRATWALAACLASQWGAVLSPAIERPCKVVAGDVGIHALRNGRLLANLFGEVGAQLHRPALGRAGEAVVVGNLIPKGIRIGGCDGAVPTALLRRRGATAPSTALPWPSRRGWHMEAPNPLAADDQEFVIRKWVGLTVCRHA